MSSKVIFIVGLPGSGKTYHAKQIQTLDKDEMYWIIIDDPKSTNEFIQSVEYGINLIICDPHLCDAERRSRAANFFTVRDYEVDYIFFENDEAKCRNNLKYRNDDRVITSFKPFNYIVPVDTPVKSIWQPLDIFNI